MSNVAAVGGWRHRQERSSIPGMPYHYTYISKYCRRQRIGRPPATLYALRPQQLERLPTTVGTYLPTTIVL